MYYRTYYSIQQSIIAVNVKMSHLYNKGIYTICRIWMLMEFFLLQQGQGGQLLYLTFVTIKRRIEWWCYLVQHCSIIFLCNCHKGLKTRSTRWFLRYGMNTYFPAKPKLREKQTWKENNSAFISAYAQASKQRRKYNQKKN